MHERADLKMRRICYCCVNALLGFELHILLAEILTLGLNNSDSSLHRLYRLDNGLLPLHLDSKLETDKKQNYLLKFCPARYQK